MEENKDNIEIALTILNQRDKLDDEFVREWLEESENMELLHSLAIVKRAGTSSIDDKKIVKRKLDDYIDKRKFRRIYIATASVAASIIIALVAFFTFTEFTSNNSIQIAHNNDKIIPGKQNAQLIFNGEIIPLENKYEEIHLNDFISAKNDSLEGLILNNNLNIAESSELLTLQVPTGGFYRLTLPDQTVIWLNSETEITFPSKFMEDERRVFLSGEAYFNVKREEKPFIVEMEKANITVLGTSFNVNSYADEDAIKTTLVNGSVKFYSEITRKEVVLKPNQQSVMNTTTGLMDIISVNAEDYKSWVDGRFVFKSLNLQSILRQLERWYNFQAIFEEEKIKDEQFQGVILKDYTIENVFKAIELATDVKFTINGRQVIISKKE